MLETVWHVRRFAFPPLTEVPYLNLPSSSALFDVERYSIPKEWVTLCHIVGYTCMVMGARQIHTLLV